MNFILLTRNGLVRIAKTADGAPVAQVVLSRYKKFPLQYLTLLVYMQQCYMLCSAVDELVRDCLATRVRLIGRTVTAIYDRAVEGHDLSIAQVSLLAAIGKAGPCPPTKLSDVLQLERSTISRNLNLLLKHRWVEAVSSDAKGVRDVALTAAGQRKIESVMPAWRGAQQQAAQLLGTEGVQAVRLLASSLGQIPG